MESGTNTRKNDDPLATLAHDLSTVYTKAVAELGGKGAVRAAVERFYAAETIQWWGKDVLAYLDLLEDGKLETVDYWKRYTAINLGDLLALWLFRGRFEPSVYWSDGIPSSDTHALAVRMIELYDAACDNGSSLEDLKEHFSDVCCAGDKAMQQVLAAMEHNGVPYVEDLDPELQDLFGAVVIRIGNVLFDWWMEGEAIPDAWWANDL
jgi:hypothetical protein